MYMGMAGAVSGRSAPSPGPTNWGGRREGGHFLDPGLQTQRPEQNPEGFGEPEKRLDRRTHRQKASPLEKTISFWSQRPWPRSGGGCCVRGPVPTGGVGCERLGEEREKGQGVTVSSGAFRTRVHSAAHLGTLPRGENMWWWSGWVKVSR